MGKNILKDSSHIMMVANTLETFTLIYTMDKEKNFTVMEKLDTKVNLLKESILELEFIIQKLANQFLDSSTQAF